MSKTKRHIYAVLLIIVPFYLTAILQKTLIKPEVVVAEEFLGLYMFLSILGIAIVLLLNKFFLKNSLSVFFSGKRKIIFDISLAFLLLGAFYFIQSLSRVSYGNWIIVNVDRSAMANLLNSIFSNFIHGTIIVGPFIWLNEAFGVLSLAFILNNLWAINNTKNWNRFSILFAAFLFSLLQINNGIPAVIDSMLLVTFSNFIYYHYRSVLPLFIAATAFQTIDLISYWVYAM